MDDGTLMQLADWTPEKAATIALVATDMDGTLTQAGKFTPMLLHSLERLRQADIPVVIVTGRSAGWVQAIAHYLPVAGAIAENGGLFSCPVDAPPSLCMPIDDISSHRQRLAAMFRQLQERFPSLSESSDNRFRLTDWTFDVTGLRDADLDWMRDRCQTEGWGFTYSTVQCHIKLPQQEKAIALASLLTQQFPHLSRHQVVTVGDSPNDESLFNPAVFPISVGVANVAHYGDRLTHVPTYLTALPEVEGFAQLTDHLLQSRATRLID